MLEITSSPYSSRFRRTAKIMAKMITGRYTRIQQTLPSHKKFFILIPQQSPEAVRSAPFRLQAKKTPCGNIPLPGCRVGSNGSLCLTGLQSACTRCRLRHKHPAPYREHCAGRSGLTGIPWKVPVLDKRVVLPKYYNQARLPCSVPSAR